MAAKISDLELAKETDYRQECAINKLDLLSNI